MCCVFYLFHHIMLRGALSCNIIKPGAEAYRAYVALVHTNHCELANSGECLKSCEVRRTCCKIPFVPLKLRVSMRACA